MTHELNAEDRLAIGETLSLHGRLFDGGELDRLGEIFSMPAPTPVHAGAAAPDDDAHSCDRRDSRRAGR